MIEIRGETGMHTYARVKIIAWSVTVLLCGALVAFFLLLGLLAPPADFPVNQRVHIQEGSTLSQISFQLKNEHYISSGMLFRIVVLWNGKEGGIPAGEYTFAVKEPLVSVVHSIIDQTARVPLVRVTIPEGSTLAEFDKRISTALPHINQGDIIAAAEGKEGILFPDTYLFSETDSAADIVIHLRDTFSSKLQPFADAIESSSLSQDEIVVLASIIEKEANDDISMRMVSGILQTRLARGMPLQVDAVFDYLLNKTSAELTLDDLALDSPFNTYTRKGLPPSPIASPGTLAINAVLHPTESPYFYYLTDDAGEFHYATNFEEHKKNKARYLR